MIWEQGKETRPTIGKDVKGKGAKRGLRVMK